MTDRLQQKAAQIVREQLVYEGPTSLEAVRDDNYYEYKCALSALTAGIAMAAEACEEPVKFTGGPAPATKLAWKDCARAIRALTKGAPPNG